MTISGWVFMISVGFNAAARFASQGYTTKTTWVVRIWRFLFNCLLSYLLNISSVRVSNELGAGNPKSAFFSVWVVTGLCALISIILAIVILCLRNYISYLFTEGEVVSNAVADLCPLLATTLILNGIQPVLSG
jgi:MATE family multidrug resistance protein